MAPVYQWFITAAPFGVPMYACSDDPAGWTDDRDRATVFDQRDSQDTKLKWFAAELKISGLDASTLTVEPLSSRK